MPEWSVAEPTKLTFDTPVSDLHVRIVNGAVNIVGTDEGPAHLQVSEIEGPPLVVTPEERHPHGGLRRPPLEGLPQVAGPQGLAPQRGGLPGRPGPDPGRGGRGRRRRRGPPASGAPPR
ncbi:hypothetical protein GCM10023238_20320 [Streptomyces heliomycini]